LKSRRSRFSEIYFQKIDMNLHDFLW